MIVATLYARWQPQPVRHFLKWIVYFKQPNPCPVYHPNRAAAFAKGIQ